MSKLGAVKNSVANIVKPDTRTFFTFKLETPGYATVAADLKCLATTLAGLDDVREQLEKIGGKQLNSQISVLRCMGTCAQAGLDAADVEAESNKPESLSSKDNRCIPVLKVLSSEISKIGILLTDRGASDIERWDTCFLPSSVLDPSHIDLLDGMLLSVFVMRDLQSSLCGLRDRIYGPTLAPRNGSPKGSQKE